MGIYLNKTQGGKKQMDKEEVKEKIISLVEEARELCQQHGIDWLEMVEQSRI